MTPNLYDFLVRPGHIRRGSMACYVADQFRPAIVNLRLLPGTMLDKAEICSRLGVSRSPVSEAMAMLKSEGLIDILPQRGTIVSLVSIEAVEESIFVRKALEGETVRALSECPPEGLIEALNANLERQRATVDKDDRAGFHLLDLEFHEILLKAMGHNRMKAMVDTARNNLDRARQLTNSTRRINVGIQEHADIVAAITARDVERATLLMRMHLDGVLAEVYQLQRDCPDIFSNGIIEMPPIKALKEARSLLESV